MNVNKYSMNEAAKKAPDIPGVYVWYCYLCIGKADVQNDDSFIKLLNTYTDKFGRQQMSINASLNFDLTWSGKISTEEDSRNSSTLLEGGLSKESRTLVLDMLGRAQPFFFQPLYIGKAEKSIRSRLNQHISEFMKLKELIRKTRTIVFDGEDDFAQRAVSLGFSEDQLSVYTMDVGEVTGLDSEHVGKAVRIVEMYLNKWSTPLLGRR